ncbi:MAG: hypothetical protein EP333_01565 [Bacteroidetes bacterium]|nr:MAG: hypothetical protein EP333_01565 [Bacteroidota bacterium]
MKQVLHDKFTITLVKDNFLILEIHEEQVIDAQAIRLIYEGYEELVGDNEYVVAVYGNAFSSMNDEARKIAATEYYSEKRKKVAFISDNLAHILIVRFYILFNKPRIPVRIFRNQESAYEWLEAE